MSPHEWVALGTPVLVFIGAIWKWGRDVGEIKGGIQELLARDERTNKRVDTIELRLNDHTERIARLEGYDA